MVEVARGPRKSMCLNDLRTVHRTRSELLLGAPGGATLGTDLFALRGQRRNSNPRGTSPKIDELRRSLFSRRSRLSFCFCSDSTTHRSGNAVRTRQPHAHERVLLDPRIGQCCRLPYLAELFEQSHEALRVIIGKNAIATSPDKTSRRLQLGSERRPGDTS